MNIYGKFITQSIFICIASLVGWNSAYGQGGPPPTITTYSLGKAELDFRLWPAQISVRVPLGFLQQELRMGLEEAGRDSKDAPFGVKDARFSYSQNSPVLDYYLEIEGKVNNPSIPFICRVSFTFAVPAQSASQLGSQILTLDPTCQISGDIANAFKLNYLLEDTIRIGIYSALDRFANGPNNENAALLDLMKSDPDLADLLNRGKLQAKYCSSARWPQALCFHISWPSMKLMNYFTHLIFAAPSPLAPIDSHFDFAAMVKTFSESAPLKPSSTIAEKVFPSKLHEQGSDGCNGNGCYDDGDAAIFNGLLCIVGESRGCDTVKDSQDETGRFWRSPDLIGVKRDDASFTGDQLKGVIAYLIRTGDKASLTNFLNYLSNHRVGIPKISNPFDYGYKSCTDDSPEDPNFTAKQCLLAASDWFWLNKLAELHGLQDLVPQDMRDVSARFGYNSEVLPWQAAFVPFGFEIHLIGIEILFAQMMGIEDDKHREAARILAARQPMNPFFLYLYLGKNNRVLQELTDKCVIKPGQTKLDQWAWERDQKKEEWKDSMRWDCVFMYRLLAMTPNSK